MTKQHIGLRARIPLLAGASVAALCAVAPTQVLAQSSGSTTVAQSGGASLEELVVTARRREERLQDVPQAVTSVTGDRLLAQGVGDITSIQQVSPSLNLPRSGTNLQPMIRGIGTTNSSLGDEPNVAIYVDGVYQSWPGANTFSLSSIQRVEVLKGPQGTLFGRNSEGGAILVTTKTPSSDFQGSISLAAGTKERLNFAGYVSGALAENVAADLAIGYDGGGPVYQHVVYNVKWGDYRNLIVRPKVAIDFSPDVKLTLGALYSYNSDPRGNIYGVAGGNTRYPSVAGGAGLPIPPEGRFTATNHEARNMIWSYQAFGRLEVDLEKVTLSSQTSWTKDLNHNRLDTDQGPLVLGISNPRSRLNSLQQEFLVSSAGESQLEWVSGLFLYKSSASIDPRKTCTAASGVVVAVCTDTYSTMKTRSWAPFGEATYNLSDQLSLTAGARYTWERKSVLGYTNANLTPRGPAPATWKSFTPRGVVQYKIPDVVNLYGSISKGFKSGVFVQTSVPAPAPVNPESLLAYELGAKTLFPGRWRASGALFFNDYKNIQVLSFQFPVGILRNAAKGETYGFEVEVNGQVTDALNINAFLSYSHTEYTNFTSAVTNTPQFVGGLPRGNVTNNNVDVSGSPFQRAPDWLAGASFTYVKEVAGGEVTLNGSYYYNSGWNWEVTGRVHQDPYHLVNASLSYRPEGSNIQYGLWVNNLTNEDISITGNASTLGDNIIYGAPRTVGVRITADFN